MKLKLQTNFLLSPVTTFQLGGPARFYLSVRTPEEAVAAVAIARAEEINCCFLGGGSNTVFADNGFAGLVVHWQPNKIKVDYLDLNKREITVLAGTKLNDLVNFANRQGFAGLQKLAAIPGQVGGAVTGNAGAYGQAISDCLRWVEIFDGEKICRLRKKDCHFKYRDSCFKQKKNWLILRVSFKFKSGEAKQLINESKKITKVRWSKFGQHPICAGSFFKNPLVRGEKIPAAQIIEQAKLANLKYGGISVAPFHHNFLINDGTGTTRDLQKLKERIKRVVHKKLGIELEEEVRFII